MRKPPRITDPRDRGCVVNKGSMRPAEIARQAEDTPEREPRTGPEREIAKWEEIARKAKSSGHWFAYRDASSHLEKLRRMYRHADWSRGG